MTKEITFEQKFLKWVEISRELKEIKQEESELRKELVSTYLNINGGKAKEEVNFIVENEDGDMIEIEAALKATTTEKLSDEFDADIYDSLSYGQQDAIKISYSVKKKQLKELDEDEQDDILEYIEEKPSMPTIDYKIIE
jgi:hypothetical protein